MALLMDRRYNPFRDFEDINRAFFGDNSLAEFKTDIRDMGDGFELEADLPGFKKEDIKLSVNGDTLTIKAERHSDFEDQDKKSGYLRCERSYGSYSRSFDVTGVDVSQISASYTDGVLRIRLPKQAPKQPDDRTIVIE
ncbi:Hsp20/alpha crystallin family protein [uncultured Gemmiger sp.]|mgnify:FL=1|uniref:Hsp20/alpha crystallin family protein n=1 Tax=uncultured Gemmiger sp. TaxID=1623490 RepID=UPI0025FB70D9|nr:Hsp20/alpha crystallin family protein [uncultured Gemmiger sp.]